MSTFSSGGIKYVEDHLARNHITACIMHKLKYLIGGIVQLLVNSCRLKDPL